MRLPVRVIESFEDATLNFERIESVFSGPQAEPLAFLQLLSAQKLQIDLGKTSYVAAGAGWQTATVTFHTTFTAAPVFLYSVQVPTAATLTSSESRSVGTASALVDVNPTVAETLTIHWAAIG